MRFLKSSSKIQNVPTVANQQPSAALNVANSGTVREIASYANGKNISRCAPYSRWVQRKKNRKPIIQKSVRKSKQRKKNLWSKNFELRQLLRSKLQIQCFSLSISLDTSVVETASLKFLIFLVAGLALVLCVFLCEGRSSIARDTAEPGSIHLHRILVFANKFSAGLILAFLGQTVAI
jgi:hypothetical protein